MAQAKKKAAPKKKVSRKKKATKTGGSSSEIPVKAATAEPTTAAKTLAPLEDLEKVFDDLLQRRWPRPFRWDWPKWEGLPSLLEQRALSVDVVDRPREVLVRAEVPGVEKKDLDVSIVDRTLTIKGSSRQEEKEEQDDYFRHEIRSGAFSRSILLPADVNASKAKASFKDGVVELHLPKVRASKRHKISMP
ncbi:MAG: Hsp20/alpha crystallin family protein [Gammaproteobacteria bacterium]|nr:Hsp20/alpha crystallin family protein [Gammaproteobacteria bacterium]MDH3507735.1 Hsp20/alpha crystallin family protein [Gammaproteobacteria bacterium]